ncbi:hypothetical protein JW905_11145 [bacterium]|nr:hypothetical protein [candidate division CSSED10-310 bacterium]
MSGRRRLTAWKCSGDRYHDNSVRKCLNEIGWYLILVPEGELSPARRIRQGDESALKKQVRADRRFAVSIARGIQGVGLRMAGSDRCAKVGLLEADRHFARRKQMPDFLNRVETGP